MDRRAESEMLGLRAKTKILDIGVETERRAKYWIWAENKHFIPPAKIKYFTFDPNQ